MYTNENSKTYAGTTVLKAWPATKDEYCAYRGWTVPDNEHPQEAGYIVEYGEGHAKANHPNHAGYISWLPAVAFEKTYHEAPGDWYSRLLQEGVDVSARLEKLQDFRDSPGHDTLSEIDQQLLRIQAEYMVGYVNVLAQRVALEEKRRGTVIAPERTVGVDDVDAADFNNFMTSDPDEVLDEDECDDCGLPLDECECENYETHDPNS